MRRSLRVGVLLCGVATAALAQDDRNSAVGAIADRRGWFGINLSCEECYVQRGPGRVAWVTAPAVVTVESGSPAYIAGLRNGDTIVAVEGHAVTTPEAFERFARARPNEPIRLTVRRSGNERDVTVIPSERASAATIRDYYNQRLRIAQNRGVSALRAAFRSPLGWLGMGLECEQCSVADFGLRRSWRFRAPPAVTAIDVDGPAHRAGLRRGDTLLAIDGNDITTAQGGRAFAEIEPGQRVTLTVRRAGREQRLQLVAVARPDASREELRVFEEYRRMRDSVEALYRAVHAEAVARAQADMREAERLLREAALGRAQLDSSRRRISAIDSVLRSLLRERSRLIGESAVFQGVYEAPPALEPVAPVAPVPDVHPVPAPVPPAAMALPGRPGVAYPLRYSGRVGNVNVEVRAPAGVNAQEVGDSVIVVLAPGGVEVRIRRRR